MRRNFREQFAFGGLEVNIVINQSFNENRRAEAILANNMKLLVVFLCGLIPLVLGVGEPTPQKELDPEILKFALQQLATNDGDNSLYHQKAVKVSQVTLD